MNIKARLGNEYVASIHIMPWTLLWLVLIWSTLQWPSRRHDEKGVHVGWFVWLHLGMPTILACMMSLRCTCTTRRMLTRCFQATRIWLNTEQTHNRQLDKACNHKKYAFDQRVREEHVFGGSGNNEYSFVGKPPQAQSVCQVPDGLLRPACTDARVWNGACAPLITRETQQQLTPRLPRVSMLLVMMLVLILTQKSAIVY